MQTRDLNKSLAPLRWLPGIAIAAVAVAYLLTLDRWFSQSNLPVMSVINGWDWRTYSGPPLQLLVSYPLRILPVGAQSTALSLVSTVLGVISMILLARTVRILPQERTRPQRQRALEEAGTLPKVFSAMPAALAVLLFGLQRVVWDNAVTASGAMIDLFLLAYALRAVAEFRVDRQDAWLYKSALCFGIGIVNNYAMIAYFPLYLATVAWVKGRSFFDFSFLMKFAGLGCAGLLLYLVPPTLHAFSDTSTRGFWGALRDYLGGQKFAVLSYRRVTALVLSAVSLLPLFGLAFRWGEERGDISGASHRITTGMIHLSAFAAVALGIAASFEYPARGSTPGEISIRFLAATAGDPNVLSVYYLSALSVGYYAGYLVCIFGMPVIHRWSRPTPLDRAAGATVVAVLGLALVGAPGALLYFNLGQSTGARGPALERLGHRIQSSLPDGAIAMSDTPVIGIATQAAAAREGRGNRILFLESGSIAQASYHQLMRKLHPDRWPALRKEHDKGDFLEMGEMNMALTGLSLSNQVYYTEPSHGFFFEAHYLVPTGMVYRIQPLPVGVFPPPLPSPDVVPAADAFWKEVSAAEFPAVLRRAPKKLGGKEYDLGSSLAQKAYSRSLNWWGAAFSQMALADKAQEYFRKAIEINPFNPCAAINLAQNQHVRTNASKALDVSPEITAMLKPYNGSTDMILRFNGPIEEPVNLMIMSRRFAEEGGLYMQAATMLKRAASGSPRGAEFELMVTRLLNEGRRPDLALREAEHLRRTAPPEFLRNTTNALELIEVEARSAHRMGQFPRAETLLRESIAAYPKENTPYATLLSLYMQNAMQSLRRQDTNEFNAQIGAGYKVVESQLKAQPGNVNAWVNLGAIYMRLEQYSNAVAPLTRAIELDKNNVTALLNRAVCHLRANELEPARKDYEQIRTFVPDPPFQVHYGLGEVALRSNRKKDAIKHFEDYLEKAPQIPERTEVEAKLKQLR